MTLNEFVKVALSFTLRRKDDIDKSAFIENSY